MPALSTLPLDTAVPRIGIPISAYSIDSHFQNRCSLYYYRLWVLYANVLKKNIGRPSNDAQKSHCENLPIYIGRVVKQTPCVFKLHFNVIATFSRNDFVDRSMFFFDYPVLNKISKSMPIYVPT